MIGESHEGTTDEGHCSLVSGHVWERSARRGGPYLGRGVGGKGYPIRQGKDWMGRLEEDLKEFRIKPEVWRETAQKAGRLYR